MDDKYFLALLLELEVDERIPLDLHCKSTTHMREILFCLPEKSIIFLFFEIYVTATNQQV